MFVAKADVATNIQTALTIRALGKFLSNLLNRSSFALVLAPLSFQAVQAVPTSSWYLNLTPEYLGVALTAGQKSDAKVMYMQSVKLS